MERITFPTFSALLDRFYEEREHLERVKQRGQDLIRSVTTARDRTARKLAHQEQELAATQDRERLRQLGDILTSNFYQMERGMARLHTVDFYDPEGREIDVPLDPLLTPQQNAAKYYKEYNKAKTAEVMLTQQLEKGRRELDYLNSVLDTIPLAEGEKDLQEIRQELTDTGYLRRPSKSKGREKRVVSKPMEFRSSAGLRISVGKNNTQNDLLTCKQAFKSDIWFHTQKIHGSHVILWTEGQAPDLQSLNEAACLAAWFSQARSSSRVPVDYTPVKYVKKPNGARPGMVTYTTYETAWVTPRRIWSSDSGSADRFPYIFKAERASDGPKRARLEKFFHSFFHNCEMPAAGSGRVPLFSSFSPTLPPPPYLGTGKMLYVSDKILFYFPHFFVILSSCVKCEGVKEYDGSQDRIPDLSR